MGSIATFCHTNSPSCDLDNLQEQLENMNMNGKLQSCPSSSIPPNDWPQQPNSDITRASLDRFRITLYLSLIPQHLIPKHLFTIDPSTGFNLRKSTDRTVRFLHQLEEVWDAADYCEEIVLEALICSVSRRQQQWGGEGELTAGDLENAQEMICRGAMGAWSPSYVILLSHDPPSIFVLPLLILLIERKSLFPRLLICPLP